MNLIGADLLQGSLCWLVVIERESTGISNILKRGRTTVRIDISVLHLEISRLETIKKYGASPIA